MREKQENVSRIITANMIIELGQGQSFYRTPKAWEIWQEGELPYRIKRIPRKFVYIVHEK